MKPRDGFVGLQGTREGKQIKDTLRGGLKFKHYHMSYKILTMQKLRT